MSKEEKQPPFTEVNWKWYREHTLICDPLWDYIDKRNEEIMAKENKMIIKEQNLAARGGKYISKSEALARIAKRIEDEKMKALKGNK